MNAFFNKLHTNDKEFSIQLHVYEAYHGLLVQALSKAKFPFVNLAGDRQFVVVQHHKPSLELDMRPRTLYHFSTRALESAVVIT